jgi:hypothetical protein
MMCGDQSRKNGASSISALRPAGGELAQKRPLDQQQCVCELISVEKSRKDDLYNPLRRVFFFFCNYDYR